MRALVTGLNGTVGRALRAAAEADGHEVVGWDRTRVPIDRYQPMEDFVRSVRPDVVYHLAIASNPTGRDNEGWLVNYEWPSELAWICRSLGLRFVYTSTVMVFSDRATGPFYPDSPPDATVGYGYEKRRGEERVFYQYPSATVARLGWQIGAKAGSNNMIDFFERNMAEHGRIDASTLWRPATSFLEDTAKALLSLAWMPQGLYGIDSNRSGHNFHQIATAIAKKMKRDWNIVGTQSFSQDQRMPDERVDIAPLEERLPQLRTMR
ncbi:MAG: sugar nucleotide-binding protein [Candidatus Sumerlaeia bacterium]|nr:sugar nucleotide-binding protein [Candidatus Sumerlaeia bacterium]